LRARPTASATRGRTWRLVATLGIATAFLTSTASAPGAGRSRLVTDGVLGIPLPNGWFGSVGPGFQGEHSVAWILAGNFRFPSDAAQHEGGPSVPPHMLLIAVGDFVVTKSSLRWPSVVALRLPTSVRQPRVFSHVRFDGRAVELEVEFGSRPGPFTLALANKVLGSVREQK
jgi:hypothetical protein